MSQLRHHHVERRILERRWCAARGDRAEARKRPEKQSNMQLFPCTRIVAGKSIVHEIKQSIRLLKPANIDMSSFLKHSSSHLGVWHFQLLTSISVLKLAVSRINTTIFFRIKYNYWYMYMQITVYPLMERNIIFTTLYTTIPHDNLKTRLFSIIDSCFFNKKW
jgi:hypothetical protein